MKKVSISLFVILLVAPLSFVLFGCSMSATRNNFNRIQMGMHRFQVINLLGDNFIDTGMNVDVGGLQIARIMRWDGFNGNIHIAFLADLVVYREYEHHGGGTIAILSIGGTILLVTIPIILAKKNRKKKEATVLSLVRLQGVETVQAQLTTDAKHCSKCGKRHSIQDAFCSACGNKSHSS